MNFEDKRNVLIKQFLADMKSIERSVSALEYSFKKCSKIGIKSDFDLEELESFEAMTSRFARTSDICTQKVIKTLFTLLQEKPKTFIDAANLLEKIEIVENSDDILNIREIRNAISHEYLSLDIKSLFSDVMKYIPVLLDLIARVERYFRLTFINMDRLF